MLTHRVHITSALTALRAGGVIAYPTETVWGLGCDPEDDNAVARVMAIKRRSDKKGLILIGAHIDDFQLWVAQKWLAWIEAQAPARPTTWVVPCLPSTPVWLTGGRQTLAVRLVRQGPAAELASRFGALVSTSANLSGHQTLTHLWQVRLRLGRWLDAIVPGQPGGTRPSRIVDVCTGKVLRD
ncbi:MAG: tRNA threonylcarbamoyladenosine biosynthesis protein RimN [Gammaproteobacteria bacterium]|nr:MAG: tRNA threonylcarbamoyladenosine biosynthesis protein RimN [Gammaproteobacteria bacterium]